MYDPFESPFRGSGAVEKQNEGKERLSKNIKDLEVHRRRSLCWLIGIAAAVYFVVTLLNQIS